MVLNCLNSIDNNIFYKRFIKATGTKFCLFEQTKADVQIPNLGCKNDTTMIIGCNYLHDYAVEVSLTNFVFVTTNATKFLFIYFLRFFLQNKSFN